MSEDKPWWFPTSVNDDYFARLREDYPDDAAMSNVELSEKYNELGRKYMVLWDHTGDAYEEYESLADDYFKLQTQLTAERELSGALIKALEEIRDSMESGRIGPATKRNIALSLSEKALAQYTEHRGSDG